MTIKVMDNSIANFQFKKKINLFSRQFVSFVIFKFTGDSALFEQLFGEDCILSPYVKEVITIIISHEQNHYLDLNTRIDIFECFKVVVNSAIRTVFFRGYCPGYFLKFSTRLCFLSLLLIIGDMENAPIYVSKALNSLLCRYYVNNEFTEDSWLELVEEAKGFVEMCKIYKPEEVIKTMGVVRFS